MVAIATGLWWDQSKPSVLAATITLPVDSGSILLSGLTLLISVAGASCWNIVAFLLHHWKAKRLPASTVYVQHQTCLRNSANAIRTIWEAFKIHQAWSEKRPDQLLLQTCLVAIPAFVVWACFSTAALFTSSVTNKAYASVVARVQPQNCGMWLTNTTTNEGAIAMARMQVADTIQARSHVANFYSNSSSSTARPVFTRPTLPFTISRSAPCPIPAPQRCDLGPDKAFSVVSDFLDSHEMLGINSRPEDRISIQMSLTCSPVVASNLANITQSENSVFIEYFLGPVRDISNFTYHYHSAAANNTGITYYLRSFSALSHWEPIPDFVRTDADVSVHFLNQNDVRYLAPVHDPWFSANGTYKVESGNTTMYLTDYLVKIMACAEQYVICNPSSSKCSSPTGWLGLANHVDQNSTLGWNPAQLSAAGRIYYALANTDVANIAINLGAGALWANNLLMGNLSPGLPDNQWQMEALGWFQTKLAKLQVHMLDFASTPISIERLGPFQQLEPGSLPLTRMLVLPDVPDTRELQYQCENQLVQAVGEVQNFSLCGVLVIAVGCAVIVLLDCSLERIVDALGPRDSVSRRARQADSKQHLLRMALTGAPDTPSGWESGSWDIPVRNGADLVDKPVVSMGLVSYPTLGSKTS